MKKLFIPAGLGFGIALALIIGQRLTTDAMAVVLGVAVGVTASVPTTVLLMALLRRAQRESGWGARPAGASVPPYSAAPAPLVPPIVVLDPATWRAQYEAPQLPMLPAQMDGGLRRVRVIGDDG